MSHKRVASSPEIVIDVEPAPPGGGGGGGGGGARRGALFHADGQPTTFFKTCCLSALLFSTVCGTLLAEASKVDGKYPYNTVVVPLMVEVLKFFMSAALLGRSWLGGDRPQVTMDALTFIKFAVPGLCYFISNNCTFVIIGELGATSFQVLTNLKVLVTALVMRVLLKRKLTWLRWKALIVLVVGSMITQLKGGGGGGLGGSVVGYTAVAVASLMSALAGVYSEKLLKGDGNTRPSSNDSLYWQNMQLYVFGVLFGALAVGSKRSASGEATPETGIFEGFNIAAYLCIITIGISGLLVSAVLKYVDNIAKCFVAAVSLVVVAAFGVLRGTEEPSLHILLGIVLTGIALEQYNVPQRVE